jgi:glycosyltransferase involved in cell wall biosynthesis
MVSLCMIVKNEEKYLEGCLESVKDVVGEIVITDTGSTDNTLAIAEKYKAKISCFPWINDFAAARNFSLNQATGDWILYLDADERLSDESIEELKRITSASPSSAFKCKVVSINNINRHHSVMSYARLFPNAPGVRFTGKVHEQIEDSLINNNYPVLSSTVEIIHLGYNVNENELKNKAERNLSILKEEYKLSGSSYYSFQLGQTLGILNRKQEAESCFCEALKDKNLKREYRGVAYRYLAINNADRKEFNKALEYIECSIAEDDKQSLNLMAAAKIYMHFKMYDKAADAAIKSYNANSMFFSEESVSAQNIMMDKKELCAHGLEIAIKIVNKELFTFFYNRMGPENDPELNALNSIYNNELLDAKKIQSFIAVLHTEYIEPLIMLLEQYQQKECKELILNELSIRFSNIAGIHLALGKMYLSGGNYEAAEKEIEETIKISPDEPSYYFYLISACLQNSRFDKLYNILEKLENRFNSNPEVKPKIELLKHKLASILQH